MSNEFISKEFSKVLNDKTYPAPLNMAMAAAWVCGHYKGINLKVLDLHKANALSDYFVIASASNPTQAQAMASEIVNQFRLNGKETLSREGYKNNADWILVDFGDIIVHVFLETARYVYDLDTLWGQAPSVEIPNEFYFSTSENPSNPLGGSGGREYF